MYKGEDYKLGTITHKLLSVTSFTHHIHILIAINYVGNV